MKQVSTRHQLLKTLLLTLVFFVSLSTNSFAQAQADPVQTGEEQVQDAGATEGAGDPAKGKELFNSLCAACHKRYKNATGPALNGVTDRHERGWIYEWVKNNADLRASGDAEAIAIFEEWGGSVMNNFPQLSNNDIDNILAYVEEPKAEPPVNPGSTGGGSSEGGNGVSNNLVLGILAFVLLMLISVLFLVNKTLRRFAAEQGVALPVKEKRTPIWKSFIENQFLVLVTAVFLLLASGYFVYGYFMQVGVDQGYEPIQPIHYSHRIHAGLNEIECKYCHSSARVSKHSGIPSLNVCMNCHKSISEVADASSEFTSVTDEYSKEFYDNEIQKLYDAVGWDGQKYTGETKPVKWVRIHNLPDFAYFNHSQHVSVAGIECQKCHGPVEEMEIMSQHSPLTMGWCINCHRETNVKMEGNAYYEKIHEELAKKYGVEQVTAAEMGGLECGKCHY